MELSPQSGSERKGCPAFIFHSNKWPQIEITLFRVNIDFQNFFTEICFRNSSKKEDGNCIFRICFLHLQWYTENTERVSLFSVFDRENSTGEENKPTSSRVVSIREYERGLLYVLSRDCSGYQCLK